MSICQVENFFDTVRKYKTKDAVVKRATKEVQYLNAKCGSIGSLKRYFSIYRNYLKENINKDNMVSGVSLLDLLLQTLRLSNEQQTNFMQAQRQEISTSQGNLRKIYNVDKYIAVAVDLLDAVSVYDRILGLAALTGRRVGEIEVGSRGSRKAQARSVRPPDGAETVV